MSTRQRPSIFQVGAVHDNGRTVTIAGWGLGLCSPGCSCHRHPVHGHLTLITDLTAGTLGLVSHRPGCTCCQPWTATELAAFLRDLDDVARLPELTA